MSGLIIFIFGTLAALTLGVGLNADWPLYKLLLLLVAAGASFGWSNGVAADRRDDEYNADLKIDLESKADALEHQQKKVERECKLKLSNASRESKLRLDSADKECKAKLEAAERLLLSKYESIAQKLQHLEDMKQAFDDGYIQGRKWLAQFIAEADKKRDEPIVNYLAMRRAPKAEEIVRDVKRESRELKARIKELEYILLSYKEYFPFLEEYEEVILNEDVDLLGGGTEALNDVDPVLKHLSIEEYGNLSVTEKNQLALDRYKSKRLDKKQIGSYYERYIGYLYECDGWSVDYQGITHGLKDFGRDLICIKGSSIYIIQAKCWSQEKLIREKHVLQLFATTHLYKIENNIPKDKKVVPILVTTTDFSEEAIEMAKVLNVCLDSKLKLDKDYPLIKCNINKKTKEKIYHLPFDQQYDTTKIAPNSEETYAHTVKEAEGLGFRRAFRHRKSASG